MTTAGERAQRKADAAAKRAHGARETLAAAERAHQAWSAGAEGERRTAAALATLQVDGWRSIHDVHWPGRPYANIDHIAVGPGGVVVIDTKNWSGRVDVKDGVLRQNGYRRDRECAAAVEASAAVAALLEPQHRSLVHSLLCLVGQSTPSAQPAQLRIVGIDALPATLRSWPSRLSHHEIEAVTAYLERLLDGSRSPGQLSTNVLQTAAASGVREDSHAVRQATAQAQPTRSTAGPAASGKRPKVSSQATRRRRPGSSNRRDLARVAAVGVAALIGLHWLPQLAAGVGEQVRQTVPRLTVPLPSPTGHTADPSPTKSAAQRMTKPTSTATKRAAAKP